LALPAAGTIFSAGARTPLALVFASIALALCPLFLTGLLENLPKAVVLTAVYGLLNFPALLRMWRVSRLVFYAAAIALGGVLLLGILQGILLAALASMLMLLINASRPHVVGYCIFLTRTQTSKS
jgi:MFS superfamily sulfate permease-like transporter